MSRRSYVWYVEPLDKKTNGVIAGSFSLEIPEVKFIKKRIDGDGRFLNLWICPFTLITALKKTKRDLGLNFRIYSQVGQGQIRECTFLYGKKRKRKKKKTAA